MQTNTVEQSQFCYTVTLHDDKLNREVFGMAYFYTSDPQVALKTAKEASEKFPGNIASIETDARFWVVYLNGTLATVRPWSRFYISEPSPEHVALMKALNDSLLQG